MTKIESAAESLDAHVRDRYNGWFAVGIIDATDKQLLAIYHEKTRSPIPIAWWDGFVVEMRASGKPTAAPA